MTMYIYDTGGHAVGFLHSLFVHDLDGTPLGRVLGSRVHRLDGSYVGEYFKDTIVDKPVASRRAIRPMQAPPVRPPADITSPRRGVVDYGFRDMFGELRRPGSPDELGQVWREAAE